MAKYRPWPKETSPARISRTRPATTKPFARDTMIRKLSQLGSRKPPASSSTRATTSAGSVLSLFKMGMSLSSNLAGRHAGEQPLGSDRKDERHDGIDGEEFDLRQQMHGGSTTEADEQRADERTGHAAQSADHRHGEGQHDHLHAYR